MTIDQQELLDAARENLRAARSLQSFGNNKAAESYAYRAMYFVAQAHLLQFSLAYSKHPETIAAFRDRFCDTGLVPRQFHEVLVAALPYRDEAFPQTDKKLTRANVESHISQAEKFIELGERLLGPVTEHNHH